MGQIIVVSGPSGVGKKSVVQPVVESDPMLGRARTCTTRKPRGEDYDQYYHTSVPKFERKLALGKFVEHEKVHGTDYYGTPVVEFRRSRGCQDKILEVDCRGAFSVKAKYPEVATIFLLPPTYEVLVARLRKRHTETEEERERRLRTAVREIVQASLFDFWLVNDSLPVTIGQMISLVDFIRHGLRPACFRDPSLLARVQATFPI